MTQTAPSAADQSQRKTSVPGNLLRGALIGTVETVPGVSGGTVALVVGIYHQLIDSASHVVSAVRRLITGPDRRRGFRENIAAAHWGIIIPVMIGMALAVFTVAGPMADAVESYPVQMRALFLGMVLASVAVPLRMVRADLQAKAIRDGGVDRERVTPGHVIAGIAAAVGAFLLVSVPPVSVEAHPVIIVIAAAVAVSALVLPGLSGSFLLLTFGLYEPTMRAVDDRDLGYIALFMLGMVCGLIVIVKILKWLLEHRHTITLITLSGVMVGALRSLWPWQDEARVLQAPTEHLGLAVVLFLLGTGLVSALVMVDAKLTRNAAVAE